MNLEKSPSEVRLVALLVVVTLALGVAAVYVVPWITASDRSGDTVESYTVTLHPDGTLEETYVYKIVSSDTRFLYRTWDEAIVAAGSGYPSDQIHIELLSINAPAGIITYLKDDFGRVTIYSGPNALDIYNLAYNDEVGAFNPSYYTPGTYTVSYRYRLYFPVDSDGSYDSLNIKFASEHIAYTNVRITIENGGAATVVYPHPPSLAVSISGGDITISGSSQQNEVIGVEMLSTTADSPWRSWAIVYPESNTKALTESANQQYSTQYWVAYSINLLGRVAVLIAPLVILGLWYAFGREEDVTVPTYLSTVPNPDRKPWYVNLIYDKGMLNFDENGFYATLLDLDLKGKIKIQPWGEEAGSVVKSGIRIEVLDANVSDAYELKVMAFIQKYSTPTATNPSKSVFDTDTLNTFASQISTLTESPNWALSAQRELAALMDPIDSNTFREWRKIPNEQMTNNNKLLLILPAAGIILILASIFTAISALLVAYLTTLPGALGVVLILQFAVASFFPIYLLGRYKPGLYKEKLEWNAFRANLSDFSQMQRYGTEDLGMWGSWLVYGTALGVGEKVAEAMKSLNVRFPTTVVPMIAHTHFHSIIVASRPVTYSAGSGSHGGGGHVGGGGGHGGGGGRGGGGAGRR
jgi:uncharacterized membrane protein